MRCASVGTLLIAFSGCLMPVAYVSSPVMKIPTVRQVLDQKTRNEALRGKLWDKSEFFLQFPFQLLSIGKFIEQDNPNSGLESTSDSASATLYQKDGGIVEEMLHSNDPGQRGMSLEMLEAQTNFRGDSLGELQQAILDPDPYVRMVAIQLLAKKNLEDSHPYAKALQDENQFVRLEAVRALGKGQGTLRILCEAVDDPSPIVRGELAKILGDIGGPESISHLQRLAHDPEDYVRYQAGRALAEIPDSDAP